MLKVNILWFISLCLSISCALAATLVQQWARKYLLTTQLQPSPQRRARVRTYLFKGIGTFRLDTVANSLPLLLHTSVFFFFAGLVEFLFQLDNTLAYITLACVAVCAVVYVALTLLPLFCRDCPYQTPMSRPLWRFVQAMKFTFLVLRMYMKSTPNRTLRLKEYMDSLLIGLQHNIERCAMNASKNLDIAALQWTLQSLSEPSELEPFVTAIPGFLHPPTITSEATIPLHKLLYANDADLGLRIGHLLKTKMHMPIACIDALWHITYWHNAIDVWEWATAFGKVTVDSLNMLKGSGDPAIALTAHCTAALAVRVMLKDLHRIVPVDTRIDGLRTALHLFMDLDWGTLPDDDLIRDGHVLNMAGILTSAIPLVARVDESRASVLWETLDMLRSDQNAEGRQASLQHLDAGQASSQAQTALLSAWEAYERESRAWTSAPAPVTPAAAATTTTAAATTTDAAATTTDAAATTTDAAATTLATAVTPAVAATTTPAAVVTTLAEVVAPAMAPAATISARCVDRYKSRMEELVAPIVTPIRGITGE